MTHKIDEGNTVDDIYLDFAKAFDPVNRRFLLAKMKSLRLDDFVVVVVEREGPLEKGFPSKR